MPDLDKYPYRYMEPIIDIINLEGVTLGEIKIASGACTPDSVEVMCMLKYISSFGVIKKEGQLYYIEKNLGLVIKKPKRTKLINEMIILIQNLTEIPETKESIGKKINWKIPKSDLQSYLDFIVYLTSKGPIEGDISLLGRLLGKGKWNVYNY